MCPLRLPPNPVDHAERMVEGEAELTQVEEVSVIFRCWQCFRLRRLARAARPAQTALKAAKEPTPVALSEAIKRTLLSATIYRDVRVIPMLHDCVKTWSTREETRAEDVHLAAMCQSCIDKETARMAKAQSKSGVVSHGHRPFVDLTAVHAEPGLAHSWLPMAANCIVAHGQRVQPRIDSSFQAGEGKLSWGRAPSGAWRRSMHGWRQD